MMLFVFSYLKWWRKPVVQLLSDEDYKCSVYILFVNNAMKVIYDFNLSNYFWNVKMYIWKNTTDTVQLGLKDMYGRLCIVSCIFAIMIFFFIYVDSINLIDISVYAYIYVFLWYNAWTNVEQTMHIWCHTSPLNPRHITRL